MNIKESIRQFLKEISLTNEHKVDICDDDSVIEAGIIDSLSFLNLISFLDAEFGVTIAEGELDINNFDTINLIHEFVSQKLSLSK